MNTFLPLPDFAASARCLDDKRLGKQRVECMQIHSAITGKTKGWINHPAVKMWVGHEDALCEYWEEVTLEWVRRGFKNFMSIPDHVKGNRPPWFGDAEFHASHRSNLLLKKRTFYAQFGWTESLFLEYKWPV